MAALSGLSSQLIISNLWPGFSITALVDTPLFTGEIPDFELPLSEAMDPYDSSVHFTTGGAIDTYVLENALEGLGGGARGIHCARRYGQWRY